MGAFPHIKEFVDKKAREYTKFEHQHEPGANPRLELHDSEGATETINIESWKTEHLEEFLRDNNL
ncbi:hypothetical protein DFA_09870 [Cavenderia fasciculata]|uniref:Selenoprotein F n=1 Tax=Cavenderia fasciculata TaxID=261658 RepID=F4Q8M8_CACFS|nr:uncharacterized protein DFA_09870 [Cavenderia fasciculata]EGG15047.1 hypothetical protein DFA_09870 [Cavenderia fasciculata]|eukprot:XP_004351767.1 hypothetical protein DFA_09870 [Cavenderia fasciculata]